MAPTSCCRSQESNTFASAGDSGRSSMWKGSGLRTGSLPKAARYTKEQMIPSSPRREAGSSPLVRCRWHHTIWVLQASVMSSSSHHHRMGWSSKAGRGLTYRRRLNTNAGNQRLIGAMNRSSVLRRSVLRRCSRSTSRSATSTMAKRGIGLRSRLTPNCANSSRRWQLRCMAISGEAIRPGSKCRKPVAPARSRISVFLG